MTSTGRKTGLGYEWDVVTIQLGDDEPEVVTRYEVTIGLLTQPTTFSISLAHSAGVWRLWTKYPPNTPFVLSIDGVAQMRGRTDDLDASSGSNGGLLRLSGRSAMAPLNDGYIEEEKSFEDATFPELIEAGLEATLGGHQLAYTNDANRKIMTRSSAPSGKGSSAPPKQKRTIQAKLGEQWYPMIKKELDRAGLFLWHSPTDSTPTLPAFVLAKPNTAQSTTYKLVRSAGHPQVILDGSLHISGTRRHVQSDIHFRSGAGKAARFQGFGSCTDPEMAAWGYKKTFVHKDERCKTLAQAEALALKHQSDVRREGYKLTYTVSGHSIDMGGERRIYAFDTMLDLDDQELGLTSQYYVESVHFRGDPDRTTTLELQRPENLVFADPSDEE